MSVTIPSTPRSIQVSSKSQTLKYIGIDPELFGVKSFDVECQWKPDLNINFDLEGQSIDLAINPGSFALLYKTDLAVVGISGFTCRVTIRTFVYEFVSNGPNLSSTLSYPGAAVTNATSPVRLGNEGNYIAEFGGGNDLQFALDYIKPINDTPYNRFVYQRDSSELTSFIDACERLTVHFNQRKGNVSNLVVKEGNSVSFNFLQANKILTYRIIGSINDCVFTPTTATLTQTTTIETRNLSSLPPIAPPYIIISGYLTYDLKNVSYFRVQTDADDVSIYGMDFPSVIVGEGCAIDSKVQSLLLQGFTLEKNRMMTYCILRVALSAQFYGCYSLKYLRRRYWKSFICAFKESEFASLADLFLLQFAGYHRYFLC